MNLCTIKGVRMEAISAVVPKNVVNNREFAKEHFEEDTRSLLITGQVSLLVKPPSLVKE